MRARLGGLCSAPRVNQRGGGLASLRVLASLQRSGFDRALLQRVASYQRDTPPENSLTRS